MAVSIRWHGDKAIAGLHKNIEDGLAAVALNFQKMCVLAVSKPNTGISKRRTRTTKRGKKGSSYRIYPNPSRPGEPPRVRTGLGRRSIEWRKKGARHYQVGVKNVGLYMSALEFGTKRVAQRPWMLKTLTENKDHLAQVFQAYSK